MLSKYPKYRKQVLAYLQKNVEYNALIHTLGGVGLGIMIALPLALPHPIRWGLVFLALSLLGHLYPLLSSKK